MATAAKTTFQHYLPRQLNHATTASRDYLPQLMLHSSYRESHRNEREGDAGDRLYPHYYFYYNRYQYSYYYN